MKVPVDGFEFDFPDALGAYVFDEKDRVKGHFHGLSHAMKAVDLVVELPNDYLFVEVKDFHAPDDYDFKRAVEAAHREERRKRFHHLREVLTHKCRDSWLYRWAEGAAHKPIRYLCMLTLDNGLLSMMSKELQRNVPVGQSGPRWKRPLIHSCHVLNLERWNASFPKWPVSRLPVSRS